MARVSLRDWIEILLEPGESTERREALVALSGVRAPLVAEAMQLALEIEAGGPMEHDLAQAMAKLDEALGPKAAMLANDPSASSFRAPMSPYRPLGLLAAGADSRTYLAVQVGMRRMVALKLLPPKLAEQPTARAQFLNDARRLGRALHPNVASVIDVGEAFGLPYVAVEQVDGQSFKQIIDGGGPVDWQVALRFMRETLSGLSATHRIHVTHGRLLTTTLVIDREERVKITEFAPSANRDKKTAKGRDIGDLGIVLHELLSGTVRPRPLAAALPALPSTVPAPIQDLVKRMIGQEGEAFEDVEALSLALEAASAQLLPVRSGADASAPAAAAGGSSAAAGPSAEALAAERAAFEASAVQRAEAKAAKQLDSLVAQRVDAAVAQRAEALASERIKAALAQRPEAAGFSEAAVAERIDAAVAQYSHAMEATVLQRIEAAVAQRAEAIASERVEAVVAQRVEAVVAQRVEAAVAQRVEAAVAQRGDAIPADKLDALVSERADAIANERAEALAYKRAEVLANERAEAIAVRRAEAIAISRAEEIAEERVREILAEHSAALEADRANAVAIARAEGRAEGGGGEVSPERIEQLAMERFESIAGDRIEALAQERAEALVQARLAEMSASGTAPRPRVVEAVTEPRQSRKVLVVDDEATILELAKMLLAPYDFQVTTVTSPEEALRRIEDEHFDVVLTDLNFPGALSGVDLVTALRTNRDDLPMVAMSASQDADVWDKVLKQGVAGIVAKPLDSTELVAVIERAVSRRKPDLLLVDDSHLARRVFKRFFENRGFAVTVVPGVQSAIDALEANPPVVVVTDLHLDDGTGVDVLQHVHDNMPKTRVIIMSAKPDADMVIRAHRLNVFDFVNKSEDPRYLLRSVERVVITHPLAAA